MTDEEKKIIIPLLEKLMNEHGVALIICTDKIIGCFEYKDNMHD